MRRKKFFFEYILVERVIGERKKGNMIDKTKLKTRDRNVYFRERKEGVYRGKHPEMVVREKTKEFLSKKQQMLEVQPAQPDWEEKLLDNLISEIRGILGKKEEKN